MTTTAYALPTARHQCSGRRHVPWRLWTITAPHFSAHLSARTPADALDAVRACFPGCIPPDDHAPELHVHDDGPERCWDPECDSRPHRVAWNPGDPEEAPMP